MATKSTAHPRGRKYRQHGAFSFDRTLQKLRGKSAPLVNSDTKISVLKPKMARFGALKGKHFGGHCKGDRNFCNAYRNFCRPYSGAAMRYSPFAALFSPLFCRLAVFTLLGK